MESVLPFNLYVGSGDRTHVVRLAFQALCRLSHLMGPINYFLIQFEKKESIGEDLGKKKITGVGVGEQKKRERIEPLICLDFPHRRVIGLEVSEIKWNVVTLPPSATLLIYRETRSWERSSPCHRMPLVSALKGTRTRDFLLRGLLPRHPCGIRLWLKVQSQDDLIYRKDKDVV